MPTRIIPIFATGDYESQIRAGAERLEAGGIVVLPTETVYGGAGIVSHPAARARLGALRGGDNSRAFTIHLSRPEDAYAYLDDVGDYGRRLIRKLWPGPVGLVFDVPAEKRAAVAAELKAAEADLYEDGAITLRCPEHIVASDIIGRVNGPVALTALAGIAPSSTWASPEAVKTVEGKADLVFDAGPTKYAKPSTILKVFPQRYEIVRQGVYDERIIDRLLRTMILFVCSGNTCRSPMAEAIARHLLAEKLNVPEMELERKGIIVISAGSYALPGARATPQAVAAVKDLGADLSHHRSRPVTVELIHQADLIFTMSRNHAQQVTALVPSAGDKVTTLDPQGDIEDPIGGDAALYQSLADRLQQLIGARLDDALLKC